jgi:glutamine amidotransferase
VCRHVAYLGPPAPLSRLLFDPPHALARQSWAPRDMRGGGTINADGFGVGWFPGEPGGGPAVRYVRDAPLWADAELPALARVTRSSAVLAAVRSATPGMPVGAGAAAPFTDGRWLFSHNGVVAGWPDAVTGVASRLPVRDLLTLPAPTDAALLWAMVRARLRDGAGPAAAVAETVAEVAEAAPGSRLNLLLVGAVTAVATAYGHALSVRASPGADPGTGPGADAGVGGVLGGVLLASEPLDAAPGWRPVPDRHLVVATAAAVHLSPLPIREAV